MKRSLSPSVIVILIFGVISLFGDMVYESARSANPQYFQLLGIGAAKVGLVFGIGEFLGYFLRLVAGILSDKTQRPWLFMFIGYGMLIAVPIMGLYYDWNILVVLILAERIGKALRNPAKDTVLSGVAQGEVGVGFAFGLQEALDQLGAFLGPLIFTAVFYFSGARGVGAYRQGYRLLAIPFVALMLFLFFAYRKVEGNRLLPDADTAGLRQQRFDPVFWLYTAFTFFATLGFVNFSTIGYHLKAANLFTDAQIPMLYAFAMVVDAVTALVVGRAYDKKKEQSGARAGLGVLIVIPVLSALLPLVSITQNKAVIVAGMFVFGVILGIHETIMRSAISDLTPYHKRGTGYGIFNGAYGLALLGGAASMGAFYEAGQIGAIIAFALAVEAVALLLYFRMRKVAG